MSAETDEQFEARTLATRDEALRRFAKAGIDLSPQGLEALGLTWDADPDVVQETPEEAKARLEASMAHILRITSDPPETP